LIALPWLVLQLSADTLALGLVLAVMSVPRAVFILVGGAVVDRHSPTRVLVLAKLAQCVLLTALSLTLHFSALRIWMVYVFALGLGLATAFSYPAGSAILPRCLPPQLLRPANSMLMEPEPAHGLLGPVLAGAVIMFSREAGLAMSFGFDGLTFAISAVTCRSTELDGFAARGKAFLDLAGHRRGARAFWADVPLRTVCLYFARHRLLSSAGRSRCAAGVGKDADLPGGAAALGWLPDSQWPRRAGGMMLSGLRPGWRWAASAARCWRSTPMAGPGLPAPRPYHGDLARHGRAAPLGALAWLCPRGSVQPGCKKRVPPAMLGRTMSLFLFIIMGLAPLASAAAGAALPCAVTGRAVHAGRRDALDDRRDRCATDSHS